MGYNNKNNHSFSKKKNEDFTESAAFLSYCELYYKKGRFLFIYKSFRRANLSFDLCKNKSPLQLLNSMNISKRKF